MKKIFIVLLLFCAGNKAFCQCPLITGAMVNSCSSGTGEGVNEFIVFTTTIAATAGDYTLYYGSANPPNSASTGHLSGLDASPKTSTGNFTSTNGCVINEITSSASAIPANSEVIFIPADFDQQYDISGLCTTGSIYVVYINTNGPKSTWNSNGVLLNSGGNTRYLQIAYQSNTCVGTTRAYTASGWPSNKDGNTIWWDNNGNPTYNNHGCGVIVPPLQTVTIAPTNPVIICAGAAIATIPYIATGSPNEYSITWNTAAKNAGFTDINTTTLSAGNITIAIPAGVAAGSYTGSLVATNTGLALSSPPQNITVTINANTASITLSSAAGTDSQIICGNTPILNIVYNISGGAGATVTGLPAGVTGNYSGGVFTISGVPTVTGAYNYTVTTAGSACSNSSLTGKIIIGSLPNIKITASGATTFCLAGSVTLSAPLSITSSNNNALQFVTTGQYVNPKGLPSFYDNFTFECWVNPTATITLATESNSGVQGTGGERYALYPTWGGSNNTITGVTNPDAGAGLSVGTNGIAVYEHGASYLAPLLVWPGTVSGWTHVAVVYINKQPSLYINGVFIKTGLTSLKNHVYPSLGQWAGNSYNLSGGIGGGNYGYFNGQIDEFRLWDVALSASTIANNYNKIIQPVPAADLYAYYRFDESGGNTTVDLTGNNLTGTLINNPGRVIPSGAPINGYAGTNGYSYLWSPGGQTDSVITVSAAGTYTVTVTNSAGCTGVDSQTVQIISPVTKTNLLNGCGSIAFNGNTYTSSATVTDTLKSIGGCDSLYNVTNIAIQNTAITRDTVLNGCGSISFNGSTYTSSTAVTDTLKSIGGCDSVITRAAITVYPGSVINIADSFYQGQNYTLPSGIVVNSPGSYQSIFKDSNGCDSIINTNLFVKSNSGCVITPAKGFTPNSDGHNDKWIVFKNECVKHITVSVYNRWGGLVYHSDNYTNDWEGKYNNNTLPDGTYYYVIDAAFYDGHHQQLTGNVTIIR